MREALGVPDAGPDLQCQKANKNGPPTPQPEKVMMTGTLQHLDPTVLLIGISARYG